MSEVIRLKHRGNKAYIESDPRGHDVIHVLGFGDDRNEEICGEFVKCVNEHDSLVARIQVLEGVLKDMRKAAVNAVRPLGATWVIVTIDQALSSSVVSQPSVLEDEK